MQNDEKEKIKIEHDAYIKSFQVDQLRSKSKVEGFEITEQIKELWLLCHNLSNQEEKLYSLEIYNNEIEVEFKAEKLFNKFKEVLFDVKEEKSW